MTPYERAILSLRGTAVFLVSREMALAVDWYLRWYRDPASAWWEQ